MDPLLKNPGSAPGGLYMVVLLETKKTCIRVIVLRDVHVSLQLIWLKVYTHSSFRNFS